MCCRYGFSEPVIEELLEKALQQAGPGDGSLVLHPGEKEDNKTVEWKRFVGDICPSQTAPVITAQGGNLFLSPMTWGFRPFRPGSLLINARAETVAEKKSFSGSFRDRRCVIPAGFFYEWDPRKTKYTFTVPGQNILYMAGIWNYFDNGPGFTIITTVANASMRTVHDRMPLILSEESIPDWLRDRTAAASLLSSVPVPLAKEAEYEQLTLF